MRSLTLDNLSHSESLHLFSTNSQSWHDHFHFVAPSDFVNRKMAEFHITCHRRGKQGVQTCCFGGRTRLKTMTCGLLACCKHDSSSAASASLCSTHSENPRAVSFLNKIFSRLTRAVVGPIRRAEEGSGMGAFATVGKLNGLRH